MIEQQNPIMEKILEKEDKINQEVILRRKKKKTMNLLVFLTSIVLVLGIIFGIVRIIMSSVN